MGKDGRQWKSRWDQWGRYWGLAGLLTWRYQRSELKDRKRWSEMGMLKADTKSCILMMTRSRACSERKAKLGWRTRSLGAEGTSGGGAVVIFFICCVLPNKCFGILGHFGPGEGLSLPGI